MDDEIIAEVFRCNPEEDESPSFVEYEIPKREGMKVLDILNYIYENYDDSFAFRKGCRNLQCGSCGVIVNGREVLACEKTVEEDTLKIEPLKTFPLIKDLVVDVSRSTLKQKYEIRPYISRFESFEKPWEIPQEEAQEVIDYRKCIDCELCVSVCPVIRTVPEKLAGPSIFTELAGLDKDRRDELDRVSLAYGEDLYNCIMCGKCTEVCPKDIEVKESIHYLRERAVAKGIGPLPSQKTLEKRFEEFGGILIPEGVSLSDEISEKNIGNSKSKLGLFIGGTIDKNFQEIGKDTIDLLKKIDIEFSIPPNQIYSGSIFIDLGQREVAKKAVKENMESFKEANLDTVMTICPECYKTLNYEYPDLVEEMDLSMPEIKIEDISEFLLNKIDEIELGEGPERKVALHEACKVNKVKKSKEGPKKLLEKIPEIKVEELNDCCGAHGGVKFGDEKLADDITLEMLSPLQEMNYDCIVATSPLCMDQIEKVLEKEGIDDTDVKHLITILNEYVR